MTFFHNIFLVLPIKCWWYDIYNPKYRENFFKEAGEVVDVRLSSFDDGSFKGYGHIEFASPEEAQKVSSYWVFLVSWKWY